MIDDPKIYLCDKSFDELMAIFFVDVVGDSDFYFSTAAAIAEKYTNALEGMLPYLSDKRLRAGIFGLSVSPDNDNRLAKVFLSYVVHRDPLVVSEAIDALAGVTDILWESVEPLYKHDSPYVRGAVLRYAKSKSVENLRNMLIDSLSDPSGIVRMNGVDELEGMVDESIHQMLLKLKDDPCQGVREAVQSLLDSEGFSDSPTPM
jgi:hypothetical protein